MSNKSSRTLAVRMQHTWAICLAIKTLRSSDLLLAFASYRLCLSCPNKVSNKFTSMTGTSSNPVAAGDMRHDTTTSTHIQQRLQNLWADVLGLPGTAVGSQMDKDATFFSSGGTSLRAGLLMVHIRKRFQLPGGLRLSGGDMRGGGGAGTALQTAAKRPIRVVRCTMRCTQDT